MSGAGNGEEDRVSINELPKAIDARTEAGHEGGRGTLRLHLDSLREQLPCARPEDVRQGAMPTSARLYAHQVARLALVTTLVVQATGTLQYASAEQGKIEGAVSLCAIGLNPVASTIEVYPDSDATTVRDLRIRVGEKAEIHAHRSGGTAYFWDLRVLNAGVLSVSQAEVVDNAMSKGTIVGLPTSDVFTVVGLRPGRTELVLSLRTAKSEGQYRIVVNVIVEES